MSQRYLVREARPGDLDAIVGFEIEIARASFADDAITDPDLHRRRVGPALGKSGEITLVAAERGDPDTPVGWAWVSARTNSLTGARYGNFRSLAVAAGVPDRSQAAELLLAEVLGTADAAGFSALTGKVHASNLGMRALYRKFGFTATHLTMERRRDGAPPQRRRDGAPPQRRRDGAPPQRRRDGAPPQRRQGGTSP